MVPRAAISKVPHPGLALAARLPYIVLLSLVCLTLGSGCAVYRKCGLEGCPGDARITAEVQTLEKVVYLTGVVSTDLQREAAEAVALRAPGVKRVVNSIALEYDGH